MEWDSFTTKTEQRFTTKYEKPASEIFSEVITQDEVETYTPQIRGSALPVCILLHAKALLKPHVRDKPARMDLYSEIGTVLHELYQKKFMLSKKWGPHLFGDWECPKCKKVAHSFCCRPDDYLTYKCDCGSTGLKYKEIEAKYKGVVGIHVDLVLKMPSGRFWVIEFKTTSGFNIKDAGFKYKFKHGHQATSYPIVLKQELNLDVERWMICYVNRERPQYSHTAQKQHRVFDITDPTRLKKQKKFLDNLVLAEALRKKLFKKPTVALLDEMDGLRPCKSVKDYKNPEMGMHAGFEDGDCPYLKKGGCFIKGRSRAAKSLYRELVAEKKAEIDGK